MTSAITTTSSSSSSSRSISVDSQATTRPGMDRHLRSEYLTGMRIDRVFILIEPFLFVY